ncbi:MAG: type 1 periplasmic binding fold superfamily protein [Methylotenera sp.]|nr:type 1 periplasmic binding fold superfamily protein [Flavobacterium sp.]
MKNLRILAIAVVTVISLSACSKDDPKPVNEQEVLTTVITTLTGGGQTIALQVRDLDGNGPNEPVVTVSGNLKAATNYTGTVTFLNETTSPVSNTTAQILTEGADHQLFFQAPSAIGTFAYTDQDANGKPIGLAFTLTTGAATTGNLTVTLKHLPNKSAAGVSTGDITNAGGATDASVRYPIVIQ